MNDEVSAIVDIVGAFGQYIVFLYLYISEKRAHENTRRQYRNDLRTIAKMHVDTNELPLQ